MATRKKKDEETMEEKLAHIRMGIDAFKNIGETPHLIQMGEEVYASLGEPSELFGIPVSLRKPKEVKDGHKK